MFMSEKVGARLSEMTKKLWARKGGESSLRDRTSHKVRNARDFAQIILLTFSHLKQGEITTRRFVIGLRTRISRDYYIVTLVTSHFEQGISYVHNDVSNIINVKCEA